MSSFDPISALAGGGLIGLAAVVLVLFNGRVAGISSIFGGAVDCERSNFAWRGAFLIGLIGAGGLAWWLNAPHLNIEITADWPLLILAGLLVGFGSRLGSGCTSGHGVCGMARGSARSIVATLVYLSIAALTVFVTRHLMGG